MPPLSRPPISDIDFPGANRLEGTRGHDLNFPERSRTGFPPFCSDACARGVWAEEIAAILVIRDEAVREYQFPYPT